MVIAVVALTVAIDLKRSGTYRPGFVMTLSRFFAASLTNRHSYVLWVLPTVLICAMWSCHAAGGFTLTATLITSGYAIILTNKGSLELYFRATAFFCVWLSYQGFNGSLNVIEARFKLIF